MVSKEYDLPEILSGFAMLGVPHGPLMRAVATELEALLSRAGPVTICALAFSFDELDREGSFGPFRDLVAQQLERRRLGPDAVSKAQLGIAEWAEWYKSKSR